MTSFILIQNSGAEIRCATPFCNLWFRNELNFVCESRIALTSRIILRCVEKIINADDTYYDTIRTNIKTLVSLNARFTTNFYEMIINNQRGLDKP